MRSCDGSASPDSFRSRSSPANRDSCCSRRTSCCSSRSSRPPGRISVTPGDSWPVERRSRAGDRSTDSASPRKSRIAVPPRCRRTFRLFILRGGGKFWEVARNAASIPPLVAIARFPADAPPTRRPSIGASSTHRRGVPGLAAKAGTPFPADHAPRGPTSLLRDSMKRSPGQASDPASSRVVPRRGIVCGVIRVRPVSPGDVVALRHRVLRAGLPRDAAIFDGDDERPTIHLGAFDAPDEPIVGCVTLVRRPYAGVDGWQLRGMAVDAGRQRGGVGGAMLAAVDARVAFAGLGGPLWCNARAHAVGFYARHGWRRRQRRVPDPHRRPAPRDGPRTVAPSAARARAAVTRRSRSWRGSAACRRCTRARRPRDTPAVATARRSTTAATARARAGSSRRDRCTA